MTSTGRLAATGRLALVALLLSSVITPVALAQSTGTLPGTDNIPSPLLDSFFGAPQADPGRVPLRYDVETSSISFPNTFDQGDFEDAVEDKFEELEDDATLTDEQRTEQLQLFIEEYLADAGVDAACSEQLDDIAFGLDIASLSTGIVGTFVEAVGSIVGVGGAEAPGIAIQGVGHAIGIGSLTVAGVQSTLPNCEAEFTGTVKAHRNIVASQGISAMNGAINLGHPDMQQYSGGVAFGGGSILGAGFTGYDADLPISEGVNSVAIGNRAHAGSTTVGGVIIGNVALGADSVALGLWANAFGTSAVAGVSNGAGGFSPVDYATAIGGSALASGVRSTATGSFAVASGVQSTANGNDAQATHLQATAMGASSRAIEDFTTAGGALSVASDQYASAYGHNSRAFGEFATAVGATSRAGGSYASAYGQGSEARGIDSTAIGARSVAGYVNSAAFGVDAQTTMAYQQMFGTEQNTYTMPGIVSTTSTARQSGTRGLVTTDGNGNLAADNGLYEQIGQNREGVAMAMALSNFWVPESKQFAIGVNAATWDGTWAVGANVGGEIGDGFYVTGGMAVSESGLMGGRVGGVLAW